MEANGNIVRCNPFPAREINSLTGHQGLPHANINLTVQIKPGNREMKTVRFNNSYDYPVVAFFFHLEAFALILDRLTYLEIGVSVLFQSIAAANIVRHIYFKTGILFNRFCSWHY